MIEINKDKCNSCGICIDVCPSRTYIWNIDNPKDIITHNEEYCFKCGHCVFYCPQEAIKHEFISGTFPRKKSNIAANDIFDFMLDRRSVRTFKKDVVPQDKIQRLIDVATNAGSASNLQSENFIVVQDQKLIQELEQMTIDTVWNKGLKYASDKNLVGRFLLSKRYPPVMISNLKRYHKGFKRLLDTNQTEGLVFRKAPCLILVCGYKAEHISAINAAIAIRNIEFLAEAEGLGTCWAGFLIAAAEMDRKRINAALQIDTDHQVKAAIMLGYPKYQPRRSIRREPRGVRWM